MYRIPGILLAVAGSLSWLFAQKSAVQTAWNRLQHGELDKARAAINQAIQNPETQNSPKAWYYRGKIYKELAIQQFQPGYVDTALQSWQKTLDLDQRNFFIEDLGGDLQVFYEYLWNSAVSAYDKQSYRDAYERFLASARVAEMMRQVFQRVARIRRIDATPHLQKLDSAIAQSYENAGIAAQNAGMFQEALTAYKKALRPNYKSPALYAAILEILAEQENWTEADKYARLAIADYPDSPAVVTQVANVYIMLGKTDEVLPLLDKIIANQPNDPTPLLIKGSIFEEKGQLDEAEKAYLQAVQIAPNSFDAQSQLGFFYYNRAVDVNDQMKNLSLDEMDKLNELRKQRDAYLQKALPHLEKAYELDPSNPDVRFALKKTYHLLKMYEKAKALEEQESAQ